MADVLFGVVNPSGKLPYTLPRHAGQVPIYHSQKKWSGYRRTGADIHLGYTDMPATPLYPFGHGLSYTTFEYSELSISGTEIAIDGAVTVGIAVSNSGPWPARRSSNSISATRQPV